MVINAFDVDVEAIVAVKVVKTLVSQKKKKRKTTSLFVQLVIYGFSVAGIRVLLIIQYQFPQSTAPILCLTNCIWF